MCRVFSLFASRLSLPLRLLLLFFLYFSGFLLSFPDYFSNFAEISAI